jgi:amino acid transporter
MNLSRTKRLLVGNPLSTEMACHERIPKWKALAVLSSDALSSVAYATEEILIPLSIFATAAVAWSLPIAFAIVALLLIVTISYQQTIQAYPSGGGAYIVSRENIGTTAGLIAGASLLIDYILTVSVSVAAGVENIASAFPALASHMVLIGSVVILIIMVLNLRGIRESASIFALPTYMFIFSFLGMIAVGAYKFMTGSAIPVAPIIHEAYPAIPIFLLLRAFSSGCSALTGIEAISNGIPVFQDPQQKNAKVTMAWMSIILGSFFLAITVLSHLYGIVPKDGETTVSLLAHQIFGDSKLYYLIPVSTSLILFLAANTSYADFPRLASLLARDRFLPRQLASLGDRLVFSNGIIGLSLFAIFLLVIFNGETHHLIPLYAVGVFLSFTLSQVGMVIHHLKLRQKGWRISLGFNALGALTTFVVLMVISITKFLGGAWMVVVLIPILVMIFRAIESHYLDIAKQLSYQSTDLPQELLPIRHTAIIPVSGIHPGVVDALRYALSISKDVRACYVELDQDARIRMQTQWQAWAPQIPLIIVKSPFRSVITPILTYLDEVEKTSGDDLITVIIPEFITAHWYHQFLHNQTATVLRAMLRLRRGRIVTSVRHHLK